MLLSRRSALAPAIVVFTSCLLLVGAPQMVRADAIDDGIQALAQHQPEAALQSFLKVLIGNPTNAEACFFAGVAYNRLGKPSEALALLQLAQELRYPDPELDYELGWALLRLGRFAQAQDYLESYERVRPGRGQTQEFLGRALLAQGQRDAARQAFAAALERDPKLKPTVSMALSQLEMQEGHGTAAAGQFTSMRDSLPPDALSRLVDKLPLALGNQRPWRLELSLSGGYNTNVIGIGEGVPLPTDVSNEASGLATFSASFAYDLIRDQTNTLTAGYFFRSDLYNHELSGSNLLQNYWYLAWQHRLTDADRFTFFIGDDFTAIGGDPFRNAVTLGPSLRHQFGETFALEAGYRATISDYFFNTAAVTDRDGVNHSLNLTAHLRDPNTGITGYFGYGFQTDATDGSDYDQDSHCLSAGVTIPLPWEVTADLSYTHVFADYRHRTSFTGFTVARDDDADYVSAKLTKRINEHVRVHLRYGYSSNDSNLAFFNYDQHVVTGGVTISF